MAEPIHGDSRFRGNDGILCRFRGNLFNKAPTRGEGNLCGLGFRSCHFATIQAEQPDVAFFEILSDNFLHLSGPARFQLEKICENYPVTLHGVGMSLGSTDPLDFDYLKKLKNLITFTQTKTVSDHLSWTSLNNQYFHDLLPLPFTEEALRHIVYRIQQIQDFLEMPILIENISSYLQFPSCEFTEWEFLKNIAEEANCLILLDINNIFVSAHNNHFSAEKYIKNMPQNKIAQFHLGGFTDKEKFLLDTHGEKIHNDVWKLFETAVQQFGALPTVIEWDNDIPEFQILFDEAKKANHILGLNHVTA